MKKIITIICSIILVVAVSMPTIAFAKDSTTINNSQNIEIESLQSIEFNNATIEGDFNPTTLEYQISLDDSEKSPTLKNYVVQGNAKVFFNYILDETNHQKGVTVSLQNDKATLIYTFNYKNVAKYNKNNNCNLAQVICEYGEVYPEIENDRTDYTLYIANDLKELNLTAATQDVNAYCSLPDTIVLNNNPQTEISITVTASDTTTKTYNFKIKRLKKNCQQVKELKQDNNTKSIIKGELFYQKPQFAIAIISVVVGILLLIGFIMFARKKAVKVYDSDEVEFFDLTEETK